jgi:hypothetical protein
MAPPLGVAVHADGATALQGAVVRTCRDGDRERASAYREGRVHDRWSRRRRLHVCRWRARGALSPRGGGHPLIWGTGRRRRGRG